MDSKNSEFRTSHKGRRKLSSLPLQNLKSSSKQRTKPKHSTQHLQEISDELFNYGQSSYTKPKRTQTESNENPFDITEEEPFPFDDNFQHWEFFQHEDAETIGTNIKARIAFDIYTGCYFYNFGKHNGTKDHSRIKFSVYESHSVIAFIQEILEQISNHQSSGRGITQLIPFFDDKEPGRAFEEPWTSTQAKMEFWQYPDNALKSIRMRLILNQQTGMYSVLLNANIPDSVDMQYNNWGGSTIVFTYPNMKHLVSYLNKQNQIARPLDPSEGGENHSAFYEALYGTRQPNSEGKATATTTSDSSDDEQSSLLSDPRLEARFTAPLKKSQKICKKKNHNETVIDTGVADEIEKDGETGELGNQNVSMEPTPIP